MRESDTDRGSPASRPARVQVTVIPGPRGPTVSERLAVLRPGLNARTIACLVAVAVGAAAFLAIDLTGGQSGPVKSPREQSSPAVGAATVAPAAAASTYPLVCVSLTIALHDARFTRANFDRTIRCVRQHDVSFRWDGRVTAAFFQLDCVRYAYCRLPRHEGRLNGSTTPAASG
jgi:hypothetical protein